MNTSQTEKLEQAWDILTEHFDRVLLVVDHETPDRTDTSKVYWHGGYMSAIGMARYCEAMIITRKDTNQEP